MPGIARKITQFTRAEIDYLFHNARRVLKNPFLTLLFAPRQSDVGRILIVTPRAVGNAPQRNKIRRRIKSLFYEQKLFTKPIDCVVIVYKKTVGLSFDQLKNMLLGAYGTH